jgi:hypothetical protein
MLCNNLLPLSASADTRYVSRAVSIPRQAFASTGNPRPGTRRAHGEEVSSRKPGTGGAVNFQVTVLKVLVSYPDGFAAMADLKRDMAILATSARDWADRTRRLAARVPELDVFRKV